MQRVPPDNFISRLYRESPRVSLEEFPVWTLNFLRQVLHFDGAIWGTGHISTKAFHTQTAINISTDIFDQLQANLAINPIFETLFSTQGGAVDMRDVFPDEQFYDSTLYHNCFKPFGIERILSSLHIDERSGIFTLLTLYRYNREEGFSAEEKSIQNRLLYHLLSAASHRQLLALCEQDENPSVHCSAICDCEGIYHCVDSSFLDTLEAHLQTPAVQKFPFPIAAQAHQFTEGELQFDQTRMGDLYRISLRVKNQLDELTARERQIVAEICKGGTFKQIARKLALSPSTVSNHLYRIYAKLGINTRSELVSIANNCKY
ncbi:transcriptional regulator, LuxR family [Shewanella halifaxensis HAW-EB4]|uniref:Transcriptional regulator, LuxR family n=1 Tax=Shewanella halifaxensis (strain HAW-EB4) TaxID=458817 RepID=B0TUB5_SHEHH|nr:helix-turn-helix transcriptional regulator [Shewanella halifaxensis]ABZ75415.1 transcriptional regulator, LuxR family [Shewanella halifaxensis HAW-EB4]